MMIKERTHNAVHIFSLALICLLAWRNSRLVIAEHDLHKENRQLQKESLQAATQLAELDRTAGEILHLGEKIDHHNFLTSQFFLAPRNLAAPAPLPNDEWEDDNHHHCCDKHPWLRELPHSVAGVRLAGLQQRLGQLSSMLLQVNTNMEQRKVALNSVPTILPVDGEINSPFGVRKHPTKGVFRHHRGVDIKGIFGAEVRATADGVVDKVVRSRGYGLMVTISHGNGIKTQYAHNSKVRVKKGVVVSKGQVIAAVGRSGLTTGPHCHYEVLIDDTPVNPELFLIDRVRGSDTKHLYVEGEDALNFKKNSLLNRIL